MSGPYVCQNDFLVRPLSRALRALGASVGSHPWPFLLLPLVLAGCLSTGFIFLNTYYELGIEEQFTPLWSAAKSELHIVHLHFPTKDAEHFSAQRMNTLGTFAALLAVAAGDDTTLLTKGAFMELLALDEAVRRIHTTDYTFTQLCARNHGTCNSPNPLLSALQGDPERIEALLPNLTWPFTFQGRVFLAPFVGGVKLGPRGDKRERPLLAAKALQLLYYMQEDDILQYEASKLWLKSFTEHIPNVLASLNLKNIQVAYFTSLSKEEEFEKNTKETIPLFMITYILTIFFSIISCTRLDCVRSKVWVAAFGVFSSGLSVCSSFGLLLFCRVPFVMTVAGAPFLILGVGVDDMFIMVSCWQQTKVKDSVKDRMADTYAEAAVTVTLTTLTDVLAFYIGIETSFQSVRSFCIYTGTALVFCYLYNFTFFGAVLALNGRREESNRHWFTFMKVETEAQESRSNTYNKCCTGGSFDESTGRETEHPINGFFKKHYGPFLMHTWTKVSVVVLFLLYLGSSIYGCIMVKEGMDLKNLVSDNSYVSQYYDWEENYFSVYGPKVMVVVTESIEYWNPNVRADLEKCLESLETSSYVVKELSESWLRIYKSVAVNMALDIDNKNSFIDNAKILFNITPESQWDINFSRTGISTSRFYIQTANVTKPADQRKLVRELRDIAGNCIIPMIVYHPAFLYFDQHLAIIINAVQNVLIAAGAMLIVSLLLIPNPLCSLWVAFAITSVIVGVTGFMTYWGVNLDSISMIHLIICTAFSVDFSAHISYAFVSSPKAKMNDKAVDALYHLGYPTVQEAASTILGVGALSMASNYIFRTFYKIVLLVILFGALHGLIFIPVFLTFFGRCIAWKKDNVIAAEDSFEKKSSVSLVAAENSLEKRSSVSLVAAENSLEKRSSVSLVAAENSLEKRSSISLDKSHLSTILEEPS